MRTTTLLAAMVAVSAAGCSSPFLYAPRGAVTPGPRAAARVAVMPFADGTEDFIERIGKERRQRNLAKKGFMNQIGALPPELWSKALADELAASGRFRSARFAYGPSDLSGEDYAIEGTLLKAYTPGEWALALRAVRLRDGRQVWERQVSRTYDAGSFSYAGLHPRLNRTMQEMFEEAGADLARTLAGSAERPANEGAADEPVETLMRRIGGGT